MTRLTPLMTSLKTLNITYQTPQETLLSTPETLPTSEPSTPQISYTIASSDIPTFSLRIASSKYIALLYGAGKFITAGTLNYRMKKNGVSVKTGSFSISANTFYTINCYFFDVKVDDVLELALWSSVSDSNWDYKALSVQPTRLVFSNKYFIFRNIFFPAGTPLPVLSLGNPSVSSTRGYQPNHLNHTLDYVTIVAVSYPLVMNNSTYGLFRLGQGDMLGQNTCECYSSATYRPVYNRNYVPPYVKFRCLQIEGQL